MPAAVLLGLALSAPPSRADAQPSAECKANESLRVMTWNLAILGDKQLVPIQAALVPVGPGGQEDKYGVDDSARASVEIYERIKRIDPDILVLNEYWIPGGSNRSLDTKLREDGTYPHVIRVIDDSSRIQSSGMMLLSRFAFEPLPVCINDLTTSIEGFTSNGEISKGDCFINTDVYKIDGVDEELVNPDGLAAKAAAVVRVMTDWGCPVNIAFTHMTASYDKEGIYETRRQDARERAQLAMQDLIEATFPTTDLQTQPVIYMGDLNTDGNFGADHDPLDLGDGKPPFFHDAPLTSQWDRLFWAGTAREGQVTMFACADAAFNGVDCEWDGNGERRLLTDAWAFEQPWSDNGVTGGGGCQSRATCDNANGERLDYILHNHPHDRWTFERYLCMQHIQRLYPDHQDLGCEWCGSPPPIPEIPHYHDGQPFSDHLAVFADFGFNLPDMPNCNPVVKTAVTPQLGPPYGSDPVQWGDPVTGQPWPAGEPDRVFPVELHFPRHYAWFKILEDNDGDGRPNEPKDRGTFSIGADDGVFPSLDIRVYQGADLSWQLPPVHRDEVRFNDKILKVYSLPDPPYYVRVGAPAATGPFEMIFRKNTCTDPHTDWCLLTPGEEITVGWPGPDQWNYAWSFTPVPPPNQGDLSAAQCPSGLSNHQSPFFFDQMYFRFFVDAPDGANPTVDFVIRMEDPSQFDLVDSAPGKGIRIFDAGGNNPAGSDPFNVKLCDCGESCADPCNSVIELPQPIVEGDTAVLNTENHASGALAPGNPGEPRPFILRVHRNSEGSTAMTDMSIEMQSDLTWLEMDNLRCEMTDDWPHDSDDLRLYVRMNGAPQPACDPIPSSPDWAMDIHEEESLPNFKGTKFALVGPSAHFSMRFCERDWHTGSEWFFSNFFTGFLWTGDFELEPTPSGSAPKWYYCDGASATTCDEANWQYRLSYFLIKEEFGQEDAGGQPVAASCP